MATEKWYRADYFENLTERADQIHDGVETYGLLSPDYQHITAPKIVELLRTIGAASKSGDINRR